MLDSDLSLLEEDGSEKELTQSVLKIKSGLCVVMLCMSADNLPEGLCDGC